MRLPVVDDVVAEENLREAGSVRLHFGIAAIPIHCWLPAEHEASLATRQDRGTHIRFTGVDGDRFARHAGLKERLGHAKRCPGFLGARLEYESNLQRND